MDLIRIFTDLSFSRAESPIVGDDGRHYNEEAFIDCGRKYYPELSDDRLHTLFGLFRDEWQIHDGQANAFNVIRRIATDILTIGRNETPCVCHRHLLRWNEISQTLGSEIFVCAMLADRHIHNNDSFRPSMSWSQVLNCDNPELNRLYSTFGLVELHSHLKASTNVFEISWLCLMNFVVGRRAQFAKVEEAHGAGGLNSYRWYLTALQRRLWLYNALMLRPNVRITDAEFDRCADMAEKADNCDGLDSLLQLLRGLMRRRPLDYALNAETSCSEETAAAPMDIFRGERTLLYLALRRIFISGDTRITRWLYEYILAKNHIRQMMIQVNNNMGFANFARFEGIKEIFIDGDRRYAPYRDLLKSQPVWTAHTHHFVRMMETRISPKYPSDRLIADLSATTFMIERPLTAKDGYGLICHFIRMKASGPRTSIGAVMEHERDYRLRDTVRRQALAIRIAAPKCHRLIGIDAAASELDSRPEVFAQGFRFLRNENLKFTYHAGEDFFDIADGLRTIDEAINFFNMHSGDRIGHGTALAIDCRRFYAACHHSIAMPAQVLLDNLAWLYGRSWQLGAHIDDDMRHRLAYEYARYFSVVYGSDEPAPSPDIYLRAMNLRGDNPLAYDAVRLKPSNPIDKINSWHRCDLRPGFEFDEYRRHKEVVNLYWRYHFDRNVNDNGGRMTEFRISDSYIRLISAMQEKMSEYMGKQHIAIECCPTSNLKISRLARYDNHPVFTLTDPAMAVRPAATVNTDDLGIFCTSLDNEFNLLAAAMLKQTDSEGNRVYSVSDVNSRIETLIRNGHNYAFS